VFHVIRGQLLLRCIAGAAFVATVTYTRSVPLLYLCRFLHGLTLGTPAIAMAWANLRLADAERLPFIATNGMCISIGVVFGPVVGSLLSLPLATLERESAARGVWTLLVSAASFVLVGSSFPDQSVLTSDGTAQPPPPGAEREQGAPVAGSPRAGVVSMLLGFSFLSSLEAMLVEGIVTLLFYDNYGWRPDDLLYAYLAIGIGSMVAGALNVAVQTRVNAFRLAVGTLLLALGAAPIVVHVSDPTTAAQPMRVVGGLLIMQSARLVASTLTSAALARNLAPSEVLRGQALAQSLGQVARLVAPLIGVAIYDAGKRAGGAGVGFNAVFLAQAALQIGGQLLLALRCADVFGGWADPSIHEQERQEKRHLL
jgi:MFS family permease